VLKLCSLLGWRATGLEIDPAAVQAARAEGLEIREGTYRALAECPNAFDCVICSHVIEHVHDPHALLRLIAAALKDGGIALISCPNSQSHVRRRFGSSWRGLEAPRHLAIPALDYLTSALQRLGFSVNAVQPVGATTAKLSKRIHAKQIESADVAATGNERQACLLMDRKSHPDLIQLVCRKIPQVPT
jgi:2-polyprenyl-3-methyl-5-hydroxy-6-metoxy-1,4-benzoquinol methylase